MRENTAAPNNDQMPALPRSQTRLLRLSLIALFAMATLTCPSIAGTKGASYAGLTAQEWRDDLDFMVRTFPERHPNAFHAVSRDEFKLAAEELKPRLDALESHQIVVELARIAALIGDGHSGIPLLSKTIPFHYYPLRLMRYDDGIYVQAARKRYAHLVGGRLVTIGATSTQEVLRLIRDVCMGDNDSSRGRQTEHSIILAELLHALDISDSPRAASFTKELTDGSRVTERLRARDRAGLKALALAPIGSEAMKGVVSVRSQAPNKPLWLRGLDKPYWFEIDPNTKTLYVQINQMFDVGSESLRALFDRALGAATSSTVERIVIDLRHNDGGDHIHMPLIEALNRHAYWGRRGRLFVAIGSGTFSAAQTFASALEKHTSAIFVGEPTGGKPNHYGSGGAFFLPNSNLRVRHSRSYFQNSDPADDRPWIAPDLVAPLSMADDRAGIDPVMRAVLQWRAASQLSERQSE